MTALVLLALLQAAPDTLVVRVPLPAPEPAPAPSVVVDVQVHTDSLAAAYERGAVAAERAVAAAVAVEPCECGGVPDWFLAGALVVGAAAVGALWYHVQKTHATEDEPLDTDGWITDTGGPDGPFGPPPPAPNTTWPEPHHPHGHQPGNSDHAKGRGKKK